jgi:hypothetical protein
MAVNHVNAVELHGQDPHEVDRNKSEHHGHALVRILVLDAIPLLVASEHAASVEQ